VADQFNTANQITPGNSEFKGVNHGRWTVGDLVNANTATPGIMFAITAPWSGTPTNSRLIRFGLHVSGRKAG